MKIKVSGDSTTEHVNVRWEYHQSYYAKNRERIKAHAREYYQAHREQLLARTAKYQRENAEKVNACHREWRAKNPEKVQQYLKKRKEHNGKLSNKHE